MKYDAICLPGLTPPGCGRVRVTRNLPGDHARGDRIAGLACPHCGRYVEHEILGVLRGLA